MSAFKRVECTSLVDKDIILGALTSLGLSYNVHEVPQRLAGFMGDLREQRAEIIIPKEELNKHFTGASNDLGITFNPKSNAYDLIVSDWDARNKMPQRIKQAYTKVAVENHLKMNKFHSLNTTGDIKQRNKTKVSISAVKII
jgi:ABC-type molybdenum transport system ATPase subunit/photorepair protein PhrA